VTKHYNYIGAISTFPYTNKGSTFQVAVGAAFNTPSTLGANSNSPVLNVQDQGGAVADSVSFQGTNYVAAPASGGTVYIAQAAKKYLIPPSGQVVAVVAALSAIQIVECLDTSSVDGRDSLENALLIL
jgi:hypothetical protein